MSKRTLAERKAQYEQDKATGNLPKGKPISPERRRELWEHLGKECSSVKLIELKAQRLRSN